MFERIIHTEKQTTTNSNHCEKYILMSLVTLANISIRRDKGIVKSTTTILRLDKSLVNLF